MVLYVHQLEKKYKNKLILENITFSIGGGEIIGLVGPNGAGKSTLMCSVLGLEEIDGGSVQINNISHKSSEFNKYISFLPSDNYLYMQLTGYDHLSFIANIYKVVQKEVEDVIDLVGIRSCVNQPVKSYSYGMRKHLFIAVSLLTRPQIIFMDEPFNELDQTSILELKKLIRTLNAQGISIVISTHNLNVLQDLTDTIWFIKDGKLYTNQLESTIEVPYEIKCATNIDLVQIMQGSNLPFQINENRLITNKIYLIDVYLQWLLKKDVKILSVDPLKRNLEEMYRDFYKV